MTRRNINLTVKSWAIWVFCGTCERLSEGRFISFSQNFELAVSEKDHLLTAGDIPSLADHTKQHFKKLFGRPL